MKFQNHNVEKTNKKNVTVDNQANNLKNIKSSNFLDITSNSKCKKCGNSNSLKKNLNRHIREKHLKSS